MSHADIRELTPSVDDMSTNDKLNLLIAKVDALTDRLNGIETRIAEFVQTVTPYLDEVKPLITAVENSAAFRMLAGKVKR